MLIAKIGAGLDLVRRTLLDTDDALGNALFDLNGIVVLGDGKFHSIAHTVPVHRIGIAKIDQRLLQTGIGAKGDALVADGLTLSEGTSHQVGGVDGREKRQDYGQGFDHHCCVENVDFCECGGGLLKAVIDTMDVICAVA